MVHGYRMHRAMCTILRAYCCARTTIKLKLYDSTWPDIGVTSHKNYVGVQ